MEKMNKIVKVMCKVLEILFWMSEATFIILTGICVFNRDIIYSLLEKAAVDSTLTVQGIEANIHSANGSVSFGVLLVIFIMGIIASGLIAMIFRNVYLIFKTSEGATKYSIGATPFQAENVRMVREIGIFAIAIPVTELAASIAITLIEGANSEVSVSLTNLIFGFIILSLSQYFAYGAKLQEEVDGLL